MFFVLLQRSASAPVWGHGLTRSKCAGRLFTKCGYNLGGPVSRAYSIESAGVLGSVTRAKMSSYTGTESGLLFRQVRAGDFPTRFRLSSRVARDVRKY